MFPLPVPSKKQTGPHPASAAALAVANGQLHPAMGPLAPLAHAANCGASSVKQPNIPWVDPSVTTHTVHTSRPHTPQPQEVNGNSVSHVAGLQEAATCAGRQLDPGTTASASATSVNNSLANQPLLSSPTSLLAALSLDEYVQQSPLDSPVGSRHTTRPTTPAAGNSTTGSSRAMNAAAVAREAAQQLLGGGLMSPKSTCRAAGMYAQPTP